MSPDQCRQARDILGWTPSELAQAADVTPRVVAAFERGREMSLGDEAAIRAALEAVGISFSFEIANGRARPAGVTYSPRDRNQGH
jgi:transcriptional regulator with XRE-family HTH domain